MALTVINANGTTPVLTTVPGNRRWGHTKVTFDASYPTGGYTVTPSAFGLADVRVVLPATSALGRPVAAVLTGTTWKLVVFSAVATEVANTTDLSADSVIVEVVGI